MGTSMEHACGHERAHELWMSSYFSLVGRSVTDQLMGGVVAVIRSTANSAATDNDVLLQQIKCWNQATPCASTLHGMVSMRVEQGQRTRHAWLERLGPKTIRSVCP